MWREYVLSFHPPALFDEPAAPDAIAGAERRLGVRLPRDLVSLLRESDGVRGEYELAAVWPADRIAHDNLEFRGSHSFRDLYMPFDALLFFGDAGNGDQFAFPITSRGVGDQVFVWDHESDSRSWYAQSLRMYLKWFLTGEKPV
jgi:hypothetical protein